MARSIYLTSPEGDSGKSIVALGLVDLLTRTVQRVGVFRPVARSTTVRDYVLELLLQQDGVDLTYDECVGTTYEQVLDDPEAALAQIGDKLSHLRFGQPARDQLAHLRTDPGCLRNLLRARVEQWVDRAKTLRDVTPGHETDPLEADRKENPAERLRLGLRDRGNQIVRRDLTDAR